MTLDDKLIRDCIKGKSKALDKLFDQYSPVLLGLCMRYSSDSQEAQDIMQEGFIKIFFNVKKFRKIEGGSFEGWMKRIMVNTALNHIRKKNARRDTVDFDALEERIGDQSDDAYIQNDEVHVTEEEILALIQELPPGYRSVFNLFVFEKYGHKEIADMMGVSENTSKTQLLKARKYLQKKINELKIEKARKS